MVDNIDPYGLIVEYGDREIEKIVINLSIKSPTFRSLLALLHASEKEYSFWFDKDVFGGAFIQLEYQILINPQVNKIGYRSQKECISFSLERAIAHEVVHAARHASTPFIGYYINRLLPEDKIISYENKIMNEFGSNCSARSSYWSCDVR